MSLFPDLPEPESSASIARHIFAQWARITGHTRANMDAKRRTLIVARLKDGYTEEDLTMAALGISVCAWNQGQNPDHRIYDSCELCFRDADHVDRFIREAQNHLDREKAAVQHTRKQAEESLQRSTTGNTYRENRGALLNLVGKS